MLLFFFRKFSNNLCVMIRRKSGLGMKQLTKFCPDNGDISPCPFGTSLSAHFALLDQSMHLYLVFFFLLYHL